MSNNSENFYKTCRKLAGFTQEQASELLGIEVRRLSEFENGHATPKEDIVDRMGEIYNSPLLVLYHIREHSALARKWWLPGMLPTQSPSDIVMQSVFARRSAKNAEDCIVVADDVTIQIVFTAQASG